MVDDPFEVMMDDRDAFALYIGMQTHGEGGRGFWRKRYIAYEREKTNQMFEASLRAQGYDAIWLKKTAYDGLTLPGPKVDGRTPRQLHDVFCVFDPAAISITGRKSVPKAVVQAALRQARLS